MRGLAAAALCSVLTLASAWASEPVFPTASRIGLVPPQAMAPSKRFSGFENPDKAAAITFVEMPAEAYAQLAAGLTRDGLKRQGLDMTAREEVKLGSRAGILVSGRMEGPVRGRKWVLALKDKSLTALVIAQVQGGMDGYSEEEMRAALKSVALRGPVSVEEQVSALPFRIGERAGFRPVRVISGSSVLFTEGPKDTIKAVEQPIVILAAALQPPPPPGSQRERLAQAALNSNGILKDVRIERSESFRLKGQDWHEIVARATEAESGQPVVVLQSIRFDPDRFVRLVGLTRTEERDRNMPRFRSVIDSVEPAP